VSKEDKTKRTDKNAGYGSREPAALKSTNIDMQRGGRARETDSRKVNASTTRQSPMGCAVSIGRNPRGKSGRGLYEVMDFAVAPPKLQVRV